MDSQEEPHVVSQLLESLSNLQSIVIHHYV